jgi:hypothetical protein
MIAIDPNETIRIVLQMDAANPLPPTFIYRFLTMRQQRQVDRWISDKDEDGKPKNGDQYYADVLSAAAEGLAGWENIPGNPEFGSVPLDDLLTLEEIWELILARNEKQTLTIVDKKKSSSRAASGTAVSADPASGAEHADGQSPAGNP